jgi:hypothetical protein
MKHSLQNRFQCLLPLFALCILLPTPICACLAHLSLSLSDTKTKTNTKIHIFLRFPVHSCAVLLFLKSPMIHIYPKFSCNPHPSPLFFFQKEKKREAGHIFTDSPPPKPNSNPNSHSNPTHPNPTYYLPTYPTRGQPIYFNYSTPSP